jgi:hypothetical protein
MYRPERRMTGRRRERRLAWGEGERLGSNRSELYEWIVEGVLLGLAKRLVRWGLRCRDTRERWSRRRRRARVRGRERGRERKCNGVKGLR